MKFQKEFMYQIYIEPGETGGAIVRAGCFTAAYNEPGWVDELLADLGDYLMDPKEIEIARHKAMREQDRLAGRPVEVEPGHDPAQTGSGSSV